MSQKDKKRMKDVIKRFLKYWKKRNYQKMYMLTQKTWQANNNISALRDRFNELALEDYQVVNCRENGPIGDVDLILKINGTQYKMTARLMSERGPYKPSMEGNWGVNPQTVLRFNHEG